MTFVAIYLAGVAAGLLIMRDPWPARVGTALVWPLGPIAFVVVLAILAVAAVALWPVLMLAGAAVVGAVFWLLT